MSLKVIELNDNALRVGDDTGILVESPGFALVAGNKKLVLGEAAKQQARIHPTSSYNRYWHELSIDPVNHTPGIRHFADIAYAHLLHLAEAGEVDGDVIFAVPGNFTRQQLAILLGLVKQSPFRTAGLVDSALAAVSSTNPEFDSYVYAEMQLHQVVLTKITADNNILKRESVIQIPGVGSQNFMDLMMQLATDLFIQQCRFNPQHDAESEQQLYNALPAWLQQDDGDQNSLLLELTANTAVHTAKMPRKSLISNLSRHYKSIGQQVAELAAVGNSKLLLSPEFAELPGFHTYLSESIKIKLLPVGAISKSVFQNRAGIIRDDEQVELVTTLAKISDTAKANDKRASKAAAKMQETATHVLIGSTAIPLGNADLPEQLGRIEKHDETFYLDSGKQEFLLNQHKVAGKHELSLGDLIQSSEGSEAIRLIQVSNV
ncbi:MAG: hypothetical protein COB20_10300 [SAR86 cluster bacterium]|uniref:Uncharacterized protein n=1 Tax=SAR86 cluster bacterium TaxID=2030880 RepID=A0A2A4X1S3_9GAMM|nr:MAG: hypothetical protein COB20_10300 [SAR86 cluster bacterium]